MIIPRRTLIALFPLTIATMLPVTGVVPILKGLLQDHYGAGDLVTSLFMSINMVGALVAAPVLGWLADRTGRVRLILVCCALADALLWAAFSLLPPLPLLMGLRLIEGAAHIGALTMLMAVMSHASSGAGRRARMAGLGGAVIFGVAVGSPLGGILGKHALLLPLQAGGVVMGLVAISAALLIPGRLATPNPDALPQWPRLYAPKALRIPYLFGFIDRLTIGIFIITFVLYTAGLGLGPQSTGLLIGAFMLTFTALAYPAGRLADRFGLWRLMLLGSAGYGLAYAAVPWLQGPPLWLLMVVCGTFSAVMFGPNLMLLLQGSTPETRGSAMAGFNAAGSLGFLVGPLLAGLALQVLKTRLSPDAAFRVIFAATGALEILVVGWVLVLRHLRRN